MPHHSQGPDLTGLAISSVLLLFVYFIPTLIAFGRRHHRRWQVLVGNLLLGWTFFIWCYCLIIAVSPGARDID